MTQEIEWDPAQGKWESVALPKYALWAIVSPVAIFGLVAAAADYFPDGEYILGGLMTALAVFGVFLYWTCLVPAAMSVLTRRPHIGIYPDRVSYEGKDYPWSDVAEVRLYVGPGKYDFGLKGENGKTLVIVDLLTGSTDPEEGLRALLGTLRTHQEHLLALMYLDSLQKHLSSLR